MTLYVDPDRIPRTLRDLPRWVVWKNQLRGGEFTKVPYRGDGRVASSIDPETWATFGEALRAYGVGVRAYSGLGFVFAPDDGLVGIDLDGCRDPETGTVAEWARRWVLAFDSYAEISPSETGIKIWIFGRKPEWSKSKATVDAPAMGEKAPGVECYDRGRYFTVTGQRLRGLPEEPQERQEVLAEFARTYWQPEEPRPTEPVDFGSEEAIIERARRYIAKLPEAISGQRGHDATFRCACVLAKGFGLAREHVAALLGEWNVSHCKPQWSERELAHKVDSALKAPGEVNYLRYARPHDWGRVVVPEYHEEPQAAAAPPDRNPSVITTTLEQAAYDHLEKLMGSGDSLVRLGLPEVDEAIGGGVEPGELVVIGARPSHGKSAVALQVAHHFTEYYGPAVFVSEEMSSFLLGQRTIQYVSEIPRGRWRSESRSVVSQLADHFGGREKCYVVEGCGTVRRAAEQIKRHVEQHGCKLAVVDYAQFLRGEGQTRYEQVTNVSVTMKETAKSLGIVLLLLCQLNREVEKRKRFIPVMSDLREAGQLEQDADVVLLLVWPWKVDSREPREKYQFFVAKNRNREIVRPAVTVQFDASRQMVLPGEEPGTDGPYDFGM